MARPAPPRSPRLVCLGLLAAHCWLGTGTVIDDYVKEARRRNVNSSSELLTSLRRQLMDNNYDYMSDSESDQFPSTSRRDQQAPRAVSYTALPPAPDTAPPPAPNTALPAAPDTALSPAPDTALSPAPDTAPPARAAAPILMSFVNDIYMPRRTDRAPPPTSPGMVADRANSPRGLHNNDLLYYLDDAHLNRRAGDHLEPFEVTDRAGDTTPTLKYKVLKMKAPRGSRRAGAGGGYRRFLQEEGAGGVAIINLGDEPFPEFRLPSARRQYMSEEVMRDGRPGSEMEVALPSDLEGDLLTRPALN